MEFLQHRAGFTVETPTTNYKILKHMQCTEGQQCPRDCNPHRDPKCLEYAFQWPAPVQPAATSKSGFEGAVYKGETATVSPGTPGATAYRVFQQGATGFVSIQSVRETAEQRATEFCDRKGKAMEALTETTATPPYILGNFPRVEIVFDCVDKPGAPTGAPTDDKYAKIARLKQLLDSGALTQQEFDREKAKILAQPH